MRPPIPVSASILTAPEDTGAAGRRGPLLVGPGNFPKSCPPKPSHQSPFPGLRAKAVQAGQTCAFYTSPAPRSLLILQCCFLRDCEQAGMHIARCGRYVQTCVQEQASVPMLVSKCALEYHLEKEYEAVRVKPLHPCLEPMPVSGRHPIPGPRNAGSRPSPTCQSGSFSSEKIWKYFCANCTGGSVCNWRLVQECRKCTRCLKVYRPSRSFP